MKVYLINTPALFGIYSSYNKANEYVKTYFPKKGGTRERYKDLITGFYTIESIDFDDDTNIDDIEYIYFIKYRSHKRYNIISLHHNLDTLLENLSWTCSSPHIINDLDLALKGSNVYRIKLDKTVYGYLELEQPIMRDGFRYYKMNDTFKIRRILRRKMIDNDSIDIIFYYLDGYDFFI